MDLFSIIIIGFHFNPTSSSGRLIKYAPTRDKHLTQRLPASRIERIRVSSNIQYRVSTVGLGVYELPLSFSPPNILVYMT